CSQGDARPTRPQRRPRQEVRRTHHHQRRRLDRPRGRARGCLREHGRPAGEGGRNQDQRHRRRRHHHRHRAGPGTGSRGPAQRGRRCEPDRPQAGHRAGRSCGRRHHRRPGRSRRRLQGPDRQRGRHLGCRHRDRWHHRRCHRQGGQGRCGHGRGVQHVRHGPRLRRGHAVRQGLPVALLRDRLGASGGGPRRCVHPAQPGQDQLGPGHAAGTRKGHAVGSPAADHRRGRRGR
ncbi:uncharacterized protein METZ01_LOCUS506388, partial [marine metagenome]